MKENFTTYVTNTDTDSNLMRLQMCFWSFWKSRYLYDGKSFVFDYLSFLRPQGTVG